MSTPRETTDPTAGIGTGLHVRVGARRSALARTQAEWIAARLQELGATTEMVGVVTTGDTDRRHLTEIGGTGIFATAVRDQLRTRDADVAVHSLKDLPVDPAPGLVIAAIPAREDPRDVLVGLPLDALASGMRIGTGSPRRVVQLANLLAARGLQVELVPIRGNVGTRVDMVRTGELDAVVLAAAGLRRLGMLAENDGRTTVEGLPAEPIGVDRVLPAAGQAALAVEVSEQADPRLLALMAAIDHLPTRLEVTAERRFLNTMEAGCLAPVGVHVTADEQLNLTLRAVAGQMIASTSSRDAATPLTSVEGSAPTSDGESPEAAVARAAQLGDRSARDMLLRHPAERPET
ncbi:hydroxymethylbilane synthase [Raineyella antarctica]|uniref:Hydroxymethylbilane synthase n=1 Tax=Raineyella antarctica TaxID=1577474 RepID=A0A1G6GE34_9ACTN|nr:hydroxymethylbilane synthase [Raineyella antarctica]SDB80237.1 hydroxymethylbilane synthase [Raineyella antarctica]